MPSLVTFSLFMFFYIYLKGEEKKIRKQYLDPDPVPDWAPNFMEPFTGKSVTNIESEIWRDSSISISDDLGRLDLVM